MRNISAILLSTVLALAGCSDDDNSGTADTGNQHLKDMGVNINKEGCEHLKKGSFVDVTAGADIKGAGEVKGDHKAYRVSIPAGAAGYVKLAVGTKGDHVIFLNAPVMFAVRDDQDKAVKLEKSETSVKECTEIKGKHQVEFSSVGTYYLKLGPSAAHAKVTLVIEHIGHSH